MFTTFKRSWELVKVSANVLRADKELIVFPIVSAVALLLVTIAFALPLFLVSALAESSTLVHVIVVFIFYVVQYFVIIFSNSALVGAALIRLRGGDPTVGDGFKAAFSRIGPILGYAAIAATVGLILRSIAERSKALGQIVASILGAVWSVATFLVVPVLVEQGVGPFEAIKKSTSLLKKTWGEQIVGNTGIGFIFGLIGVALFMVGVVVVIVAAKAGAWTVALPILALLVIAIGIVSLVSSALNGIYVAALYQYAAEGGSETYFKNDVLAQAFRAQR